MKKIKKISYSMFFILNLFLYKTVFAVSLDNPLGETSTTKIFNTAITSVLGIVGSLAFLVFFVGGIMWITSGGNEEKVKKGTNAMIWASIGIVVIFSSYAIIRLILKSLL